MSPGPLAAAEAALFSERRALTKEEALDLARLPLDELPDLIALAHRTRLDRCGPGVELESLVNAKSGACPEDCSFCGQSARVARDADMTVYPFLSIEEMREAARRTHEAGISQFCIVAAQRAPSDQLVPRVADAVASITAEFGLEVGCSLGLLTRDQAQRLATAGVHCYNHNLETARRFFPRICTTHAFDDRVRTARLVRQVGMRLCCGGILGLGETLADRVDLAFDLVDLEPAEVPINFLNPRPGTPLAHRPLLDPREALQAVALFRLVLPDVSLRLAGGRELVLGELQALGMYAGANALVAGNYLTTSGRAVDADRRMLASLGMPVTTGPACDAHAAGATTR